MPDLPRYSFHRREKINECVLCSRPRSRRYRESQDTEALVCSKCAKWNEQKSEFKKVIIEVHNHYHTCQGPETHRTSSQAVEVGTDAPLNVPIELLGDIPFISYLQGRPVRELSTIQEESPPPVNYSTKPTFSNWSLTYVDISRALLYLYSPGRNSPQPTDSCHAREKPISFIILTVLSSVDRSLGLSFHVAIACRVVIQP